MRNWFIKLMIIVSIVLFLFGVYKYNFPGISIDDIDYEEHIVEVEKINISVDDETYGERKFAVFTINNDKKSVHLNDIMCNTGDKITVYKLKDEYYDSKDDLLLPASGATDLIVWSIVCFFATVTYACFSRRTDYKSEKEIDFDFSGMTVITKNNFDEEMKKLNLRKSLVIYPFSVVLWIASIGFLLCSLFGEDIKEYCFFYILMSIIFWALGKFIVICGSIKYKCKKALRSKGEVYIGECFYKSKDVKTIDLGDSIAKSYLLKVCDANGKALNEWIEITKKLYNTVTKETKLNLIAIKIDGLVKFFVVEEKN